MKEIYAVICSHFVGEACVSKVLFQIAQNDRATNLADLLSKSLPDPHLRDSLDSYLTELGYLPSMGLRK